MSKKYKCNELYIDYGTFSFRGKKYNVSYFQNRRFCFHFIKRNNGGFYLQIGKLLIIEKTKDYA